VAPTLDTAPEQTFRIAETLREVWAGRVQQELGRRERTSGQHHGRAGQSTLGPRLSVEVGDRGHFTLVPAPVEAERVRSENDPKVR
jgi:hypothetical protein